MSGAAVTQKLSQNQKSKLKQLKVPHILKIDQIEIKNIQNKCCSAILGFAKPLKTIVANFISKWINYPRKIVSSDLKGFLQGIWAFKQDYKDTKLQRYKVTKIQEFKITKFQGYKDTRILF